jgi:hypothetical protein
MIVNAAIFTCSICGEASGNICAYCTKDACSNHRCERCKRCSDCCECDVPLSAEEPVALELAADTLPEPEPVIAEASGQEAAEPEGMAPDVFEPHVFAPELFAPEPAPKPEPRFPVFLTAAESSVFVAGSVYSEPPEPEPSDLDEPDDKELPEPRE